MCYFSFCSKRLKDNVSIHKPPKDPEIKKKQFNFVAKTRENVSKLNTVYVCSDHFTEDDYTINLSKFGLLTSGKTDVKRGVKEEQFLQFIQHHQRNNLFKKNNSLGQRAKSRGVSIPKTARPSLASIKKDKSVDSKIKVNMFLIIFQ